MSYSWEEIKDLIEKVESKRVIDSFLVREAQEAAMEAECGLTRGEKEYLNFIGVLCAGISAGLFTIIFNFIFFVWLLHIEF